MHIFSFSAVTWEFALVGRTRWLTECWVRRGVPTTFVETPFVHPLRTLAAHLRRSLWTRPPVRIARPWPPHPILRWPRMQPAHLRESMHRRAAAFRRRLERYICWEEAVAVVITPAWAPWFEVLPFRHVIYDCIDEPAVHTPTPDHVPLYLRWERELIDRASGAVATVGALADAIRAQRAELPIAAIPNGVDVDWFQTQADALPPPGDVRTTGRPVVGFVGALYDWIDWKMIAHVARRLAEVDFVLIGPVDAASGPDRLRGLNNVRLLGPRPYHRVASYVQAFDVCWVPFRQQGVAAAMDPVKVYEYLALGKPVVTTPVGDLAAFGEVLSVGRSAEEIAGQLQAAIGEGRAGRAERIAFARDNAWDSRAAAYVDFAESLMDAGGAASRPTEPRGAAGRRPCA